jgi:lysophospholipase L1-like esterase
MRTTLVAIFAAVLAAGVAQAVAVWGQCGGTGYTGSTVCDAGSACVVGNPCMLLSSFTPHTSLITCTDYSQCQPSGSGSSSSSSSSSTTSKSTTTSTTVSTTKTTTTTSSSPTSTGSAQVQLLGRVLTNSDSSYSFTWPYSGLRFAFSGTQADVTFSVSGQNGFTLSVDGGNVTQYEQTSGSTYKISTGALKSGTHTVEVRKITEANTGTVALAPTDLVVAGTYVATTPNARQLEFIGDSITAGYGVDGVNPCSFTPQTENAGHSYAAIAAATLHADVSVIAWSGKGVTRNYPNSDGSSTPPVLPTLWLQTSALATSPAYTFPAAKAPQAVVINLGTNDFAYLSGSTAVRAPITLSQYQSAMDAFVTQVRSKYPSAAIFLASSPLLSDGYPSGQNQKSTQETALQNIVATHSNTFFVSIPAQGSESGCDYHPNLATQTQDAAIVAAAIQKQLKW